MGQNWKWNYCIVRSRESICLHFVSAFGLDPKVKYGNGGLGKCSNLLGIFRIRLWGSFETLSAAQVVRKYY